MWVEDGLRPQLESIDESGVPFALGVSPPIVIGTFKRRTPQANGTVDAQAGLGQPGQPVPQLRYLPLPLFGLVHLPALTGPQTACSSLIRDAPGPVPGLMVD